MITYVTGDATCPQVAGNKIIAHVCNDVGGWGRGFVLAVSKRWPHVEADYREWHRTEKPFFGLGEVKVVKAADEIYVANMIAQRDTVARDGVPPIRYHALEMCLRRLAALLESSRISNVHYTVHMPRIGCGLAGGTWDRVEPLVEWTMRNTDVYVYDLPK